MTARTRLVKELKELSRSGSDDILLEPDESNIQKWKAYVKGPNGTPYQGGVFQLNIRVPDQYPLVPPTVQYHTRIFHPNVHFKTGEICLDILKNAWSPAWTLQSTCQAIVALMSDAAPDSPLNCALAMCAATTPSPTCTPPSMPRQCRLYGCRRRCMRLRHVHKALGSPFV